MNNETGLVSPAGEPINSYTPPTNAEVMAEASKKCKTCKGDGYYRQWVGIKDPCAEHGNVQCACTGREVNTQVRVPRICGCAVKRWQKKHGVEILSGAVIAKPFVDAFTGKRTVSA